MADSPDCRHEMPSGQTGLCYDDAGELLVLCGSDGTFKILRGEEDDDPQAIDVGFGDITTIATKNNILVMGCLEHIVPKYSLPNGEFEGRVVKTTTKITCIDFDHKGERVAVASEEPQIYVIDVEDRGKVLLDGHKAPVLGVSFDPLKKYLLSTSCDGTAKVWHLKADNAECVATHSILPPRKDYASDGLGLCWPAWRYDGKEFALPVGEEIHVFERESPDSTVATGESDHAANISIVRYSPVAQCPYLASGDVEGEVIVRNVATKEIVFRSKGSAAVTGIAFHPTENRVAWTDVNGSVWWHNLPAYEPLTGKRKAGVSQAVDVDADGDAADEPPAAGKKKIKLVKGRAAFDSEAEEGDEKESGGEMDGDEFDALDAREGKKGKGRDAAKGDDPDMPRRHWADDLVERLEEDYAHDNYEDLKDFIVDEEPAAPARAADRAPVTLKTLRPELREQLQPSFQPAASEETAKRRFLAWNMTGTVTSRDEDSHHSIYIEFADSMLHSNMNIRDDYGYTVAALNDRAVVLSNPAGDGVKATVHLKHFDSWAVNSDWTVELPDGESPVCLAIGDRWAAVATTKNNLRVYSNTGRQMHILTIPKPVAMAGHNSKLALCAHHAWLPDDQGLTLTVIDLEDIYREDAHESQLLVSPGARLEWLGFTDTGLSATCDSEGVVRVRSSIKAFPWVQVADLKCGLPKKTYPWVIGIMQNEVLFVQCKGTRTPAVLPKPVVHQQPFKMLASGLERESGRLEEAIMREELLLFALHNPEEDADIEPKMAAALDTNRLKLIQMALQLDRPLRVLDLATTLLLPKSLNIAIRLAERSRQPKLAEKIALVLEAKEQALLALEEERAAKRAPQYYYEPRAASPGPERMDTDTDRDAREAARDPSPPRKQGGGRRNRERQEDEYIDVDADDGPADRSEFAFKAAPENEQPAQSSKPKKTKTNPFAVSSPQPQKLKRSTSFFEAVDSMIPKSPAAGQKKTLGSLFGGAPSNSRDKSKDNKPKKKGPQKQASLSFFKPRQDQAPLQKPDEVDAAPAEDAAAPAPEPEAQEAGDIADAAGSTSAPQDPKEKPQSATSKLAAFSFKKDDVEDAAEVVE